MSGLEYYCSGDRSQVTPTRDNSEIKGSSKQYDQTTYFTKIELSYRQHLPVFQNYWKNFTPHLWMATLGLLEPINIYMPTSIGRG